MPVGICPISPGLVLGPFCVPVSLTMIGRVSVCPFRFALTVTTPPVVPDGVNTAVDASVGDIVPTSPWSTLQATLAALQFRVALNVTVGDV